MKVWKRVGSSLIDGTGFFLLNINRTFDVCERSARVVKRIFNGFCVPKEVVEPAAFIPLIHRTEPAAKAHLSLLLREGKRQAKIVAE